MKIFKIVFVIGWLKVVELSFWVLKLVRFVLREGVDEVIVDLKFDGKYSLINWIVLYYCNWYYMVLTYKIVFLMIYWNIKVVCLIKNEI